MLELVQVGIAGVMPDLLLQTFCKKYFAKEKMAKQLKLFLCLRELCHKYFSRCRIWSCFSLCGERIIDGEGCFE